MSKLLRIFFSRQNIMILVAGCVSVAYIVSLLSVTYFSQINLRHASEQQFKLDAEKLAEVMSYFFDERRHDLKQLATARELSNYFANEALGMSMEYGLGFSLLAISDLFNQIIKDKQIKHDPIYNWIIFVDQQGRLLVSSRSFDDIPIPAADLTRLLTNDRNDPLILVTNGGSQQRVVVTVPYFFKQKYLGQLIAEVAHQNPFKHLLGSSSVINSRYTCISTRSGCLTPGRPVLPEIYNLVLPRLLDLPNHEVKTFSIRRYDGTPEDILAVSIGIRNAPLSLTTFAPATEVLGSLQPWQLLLMMAVLALLVLFGVLLVIHINTQNQVLQARYDEAAKQQTALQIKNAQLRGEIVKRQEGEALLNHIAHHDPLTNLPNRILFNDRLHHALGQARQAHGQVAVLFLDLDRFKNVNDTLGHPVGDRLLQAVADRLNAVLRREDTIARLGGDEFIAIVEGPLTLQDIATVAQKLLNTLTKPFELGTREVFLTSSIGISLYPDHGEDVTELVKNADAAMYWAKERGKNNYQFYTVELTTNAHERLTLESSLWRALDREEFVLYYQPQFAIPSNRITSVEALIRWQSPGGELILPSRFIPIAEEIGLIEAIGEWALFQVCRQARIWQLADLPPVTVAVNLSGRHVMSGHLVDKVEAALRRTQLEACYLELELTESALMHEADRAISTLDSLKELGVALVIDDFGTGYSSMSYLKRFNVDKLKIDRSFILDLPEDANDRAIVRAIIALGHSLQLRVSAEGVETLAQDAFIRTEGCDERQGYLLARPMPAESLATLLQKSADPCYPRSVIGKQGSEPGAAGEKGAAV